MPQTNLAAGQKIAPRYRANNGWPVRYIHTAMFRGHSACSCIGQPWHQRCTTATPVAAEHTNRQRRLTQSNSNNLERLYMRKGASLATTSYPVPRDYRSNRFIMSIQRIIMLARSERQLNVASASLNVPCLCPIELLSPSADSDLRGRSVTESS